MKELLSYVLCLSLITFLLIACSSGGGNSGSSTPSSISGKVADGYVSGAIVKIYGNSDMTTEIGSGATNSSGEFIVNLSINSVPTIIYIKTEGGIDITTNMPAPTMMFVGEYINGSLNVTPLTDRVAKEYKQNLSAGIDAAYTTIAGKLGIDLGDLKDNPVTNSITQNSMYDVLASGTQGNTLPDGDYEIKLLYFFNSEMASSGTHITNISDITNRMQTVNITVTGGNISGAFDINADGLDETIEGRVQGTALYINFYNETNMQVYRFAGDISLSAASGNVVKVVGTSVTAGRFIATFTRAGTTPEQSANLIVALSNIINGQRYSVARNVCFTSSPTLFWGGFTVSDFNSSGFSYSDLSISGVTGHGIGTSLITGDGTATFFPGSRIWVYSKPFTWYGTLLVLYQMGAAGNSRALGISSRASDGIIIGITEPVGMKQSNAVPLWESSTTYNMQVAVIGLKMLGANRVDLLDSNMTNGEMTFSGSSFTTPEFDSGTLRSRYFSYTDPVTGAFIDKVISGNTVMEKSDDQSNWANFGNSVYDYLMAAEMNENGAMSGTRMEGGTAIINGNSINIKDYPLSMVMFARKEGIIPPDVNGTRNFLARSLYFNSWGGIGASVAYGNYYEHRTGWMYGTLTINTSAGTGAISYTTGSGDSDTVTLTVEKLMNGEIFTGMIHIHGVINAAGNFMDMFWPVGGNKATYVISTASDGTVSAVGEAYVTD